MAASSLTDLHFVACSCAVATFEELERVMAYEETQARLHQLRPSSLTFDLDDKTERHRLHEHIHDLQKARCAPSWLPKWLPLAFRAWWGTPAFLDAYREQHHECGFLGNPFELEARRAEVGPFFGNDEPTPVAGAAKGNP